MASLQDLPRDMFFETFSHMTYTDIVAFGKTDRNNHEAAVFYLQNDSTWKQIVSGQYFVNKSFPEIAALVAKDEIIRKYALIYYLKIYQNADLAPLIIKNIKDLLPEIITIRLDDNVVSGNKYFLQGVATAIKWAQFNYRIYIRMTEDNKNDIELPLVKFSYLFIKFGVGRYEATISMGYQTHKINFDDLEVLSGIKTIFVNNNLPFLGSYYDRHTESKIQID